MYKIIKGEVRKRLEYMNEDTFCIFMCAGIHEQQWNTKECENSNSDRHSSILRLYLSQR